MKELLIIYMFTFFCLTSCGQMSAEPTTDEALSSVSVENNYPNVEESDFDNSFPSCPKDPVLFDFSVLPKDDFPRGMWTVNQLISKYGNPRSIKSDPYFIITVVFDKVQVTLKTVYGYGDEELQIFSFYNEIIQAESAIESNDYDSYNYFDLLKFDLNENDKNIELRVINLSIVDNNIVFPNDIKIGESTRLQIINYYPVDSWEYNDDRGLYFSYDFRDENGNLPEYTGTHGSIIYIFDENEFLIEVSIWWHWFSK